MGHLAKSAVFHKTLSNHWLFLRDVMLFWAQLSIYNTCKRLQQFYPFLWTACSGRFLFFEAFLHIEAFQTWAVVLLSNQPFHRIFHEENHWALFSLKALLEFVGGAWKDWENLPETTHLLNHSSFLFVIFWKKEKSINSNFNSIIFSTIKQQLEKILFSCNLISQHFTHIRSIRKIKLK